MCVDFFRNNIYLCYYNVHALRAGKGTKGVMVSGLATPWELNKL